MRKIYLLLFFTFSTLNLVAQKNYEPERIIWEGKEHPYRYHHMEQYFRYYPDKRPVPNIDTTILNRKYVALFEVKEKKIYLNNLYISGKDPKKKDLSVMHELNSKNEPLFLGWISGLFDVGIGPEQFQKNDSLTPYYNNYIVFEVNKGQIGRTEYFTYNQLKLFKDYQYKRFKETLDYVKLYRRLIYNGLSEYEASTHIYEFILFYSKSNFLKKK
ncbi:hypothetical protein H1R17_02070 [Flavobacterium sp. xlx-214]|uniref:hypothetical protein n=1 Tax=unclassified Flavobacterium TaxID=196869 RepID=UPI0013D5B2D4|nr:MULTISPECIES: hypothetical protein [unclassified Flavobacterium]MBA5792810.1 hypothetical protein [Flavobacterium sp. xlx-221]QMI83946.1 hypothetical protein H1R17_02070 [Flavobacterium sp. xlx-214]